MADIKSVFNLKKELKQNGIVQYTIQYTIQTRTWLLGVVTENEGDGKCQKFSFPLNKLNTPLMSCSSG